MDAPEAPTGVQAKGRVAADYTRFYPAPPVLPTKGVTWEGKMGQWRATSRWKGERIFGGDHWRRADAVAARHAACLRLPGFGNLVAATHLKRLPTRPGHKPCASCGVEFPLTEYPVYGKKYPRRVPYCPQCRKRNGRAHKKRWYRDHCDELLAKQRVRHQKRKAERAQDRADLYADAARAIEFLYAAGWKRDEMAEAVGVSNDTITLWRHRRHGQALVRPDALISLVRLAAEIAAERRSWVGTASSST
jgi:hypothetical protein